MPKCCLCGTFARVFHFPKRETLRERWLAACHIQQADQRIGVCIKHFEDSAVSKKFQKQTRTLLKFNAVPTIMLHPPNVSNPAAPGPSTTAATTPAALAALATPAAAASNQPSVLERQSVLPWTPGATTGAEEPEENMLASTPATVRATSSISTPGRGCDLDCMMEDEEIDGVLELDGALGGLGMYETEDATNMPADTTLEGKDDTEPEQGHWRTRSAVVSEPQLLSLAREVLVHCCRAAVMPAVKRVSISFVVEWTCARCKRTCKKWMSTEKVGQVSVMDTVWASAVVFSGCHEAKVNRMLEFANMGKLSHAAFFNTTSRLIEPVVRDTYQSTLSSNREAAMTASPDGLVLSGACQTDSPGYSASYGTYTVMDHTTGHILAQNTVCRQEVGFPSPKLETEGASRCLDDLQHLPIKEFVSDQHLGVKKVVKRRLPEAAFSYDIWHAAKNVARRLREHATKNSNRALGPWIRHVQNHFWWCAQSCGGDVNVFKKRWSMVCNHVVDIHATGSGMNMCHHEELPKDADREAPWLEPGSPAHKVLRDVVMSSRTLDLVPYVVNSRHTGGLQVFHAATLVYTPKLTYFTPPMYTMKKRLAVIDYTAHIKRDYARKPDGTVKTQRVYSRVSDSYTSRPLKVTKKYSYVRQMLEAIVERRLRTTIAGAAGGREDDPRRVLPHVHRGPRPNESRERLEESRTEHRRLGAT